MRLKNLLFLEFLNIHKGTKTIKLFKKHIVGTHMGSKATTTNFKFWPNLIFFIYRTLSRYASKNHKPLKSGVIWKIFSPDPKSHTQVGSLSEKNASEKFSRLGTLKGSGFKITDPKQILLLKPKNYKLLKVPKHENFSLGTGPKMDSQPCWNCPPPRYCPTLTLQM